MGRTTEDRPAIGIAAIELEGGTFVLADEPFAALFGDGAPLAGRALVELIEPDARPALVAWLERARTEATLGLDVHAVGGIWLHVGRALGTDGRALGVVRDLTAELAHADREQQLVAASRAKTSFLANMSHELRTPLNAVLGLSEALLEQTFGAITVSQANALMTIHSSGKHLLALINDVLDLARVEAGTLPIEAAPLSLAQVIEESLELLQGGISARFQKLVTASNPDLPLVEADKRRIKQVLINLVTNASKFSPPGSTIMLAARALPDRWIEIVVADRGVGIAPDDHERIFEPFVMVEASLTREHGGAGLGLSLVKRIVELHGGTVRVDSAPGAGATFTVRLPPAATAAAPSPDVAPRADRERVVPASAPTVLLVEDHPATASMVQAYLQGLGHNVRVVGDGASGVAAALERDVGLVLMDVNLPVLDGLEAIRRIRRDGRTAALPIVALTAYAMPEDEARCLAAGATAYLAKPVPMRQLAEVVEQLLVSGGGR